MATSDYIKQGETMRAADMVSAFNEKENIANKMATLTNNDTDYPTTALLSTELNKKANDSDVIKLTGNQTIAGTKTFSTSPLVPSKNTTAGNNPTYIATEAQVVSLGNNYGTGLTISGSSLTLTRANGNSMVNIGFFPVPDYANMETTNHITSNGGTWTVTDNGYVVMNVSVNGNTGHGAYIINDKVVNDIASNNYSRMSSIYPVKSGDVCMITWDASGGGPSCLFIPIKWVSITFSSP